MRTILSTKDEWSRRSRSTKSCNNKFGDVEDFGVCYHELVAVIEQMEEVAHYMNNDG